MCSGEATSTMLTCYTILAILYTNLLYINLCLICTLAKCNVETQIFIEEHKPVIIVYDL